MDWAKLQVVHDKALLVPVSFSLNYAECDDSWYFCVSSVAPEEEWTGRGATKHYLSDGVTSRACDLRRFPHEVQGAR